MRVGFAEAMIEGPEAEGAFKQVHPECVSCQRLREFAQGIGLGVGSDAEQAWTPLEPAQRGGRLACHARGVAGLDLAEEELLLVGARELGQFGHDFSYN